MAHLSLHELAQMCNGQQIGNGNRRVDHLLFDSRKVFVSEASLFVAIKGVSHNGHAFITDLYKRGLRCFLMDANEMALTQSCPDGSFILVKDSLTALQAIAAHVRSKFTFPVIGITGSNGKTVVKEWAARLLESSFQTGRSPRSYNSQLGVPLSIWMLPDNLDVALLEAGISQLGEMQRLAACMQPDIGVFTTLGQAHQEGFRSLEEKLHEKLSLFESCKLLIYCIDHAMVREALDQRFPKKETLSYGQSEEADLQLLSLNTERKEIVVEWQGSLHTIVLPFVDVVSVDNILLSMLIALKMGVTMEQLKALVPTLQPVAMRLEQKEGINNCLLIDDAYNSDITSLELALDFLNQLGARQGLSKTVILSDIQQSGQAAEWLYPQVIELARQKGVNRLIGIGPQLYQALQGENAYLSTDDFLKHLVLSDFKDEAILLKGSRSFSFEKVSALLEKRRHKTVLEINLNALSYNVQFFQSQLQAGVKLLAMVKAFSYGSGAFEIANLLQHHKVDYLGVAFADEGIELREAGIHLPIIVMNPEVSSFPLMLEYDLEPEIYSFGILKAFEQVVERHGMERVPIHIKLDTGMNRLGFLHSEVNQLIGLLANNHHVRVASVFSHLAASDEPVHDAFTKDQIDLFVAGCKRLEEGLKQPFIKHILNSAGVERHPEAQFDMVRLGIGMYGVSSDGSPLQRVATLKSYVSQLKQVTKGQTVGYGRKGVVSDEMTVAIVPIGYADGYNRRLSNGVGLMLVNGQKARVVGNICMDMCMIDVTGLTVAEGDEVEVFGSAYTIEDMAKDLGTIPYEILTGISRRVKRVYSLE